MKNIDNATPGVDFQLADTDNLPEGSVNLYFTISRTIDALKYDSSYKNAESIFGIPIDGPSTQGGQILVSDGVTWNTTNQLILNNSDLTVSTGAYSAPNAYYGRYGPRSFQKAIGNQKVLTVFTTLNSSGYIEFFINAREPTSGAKYHMHQSIDYENNGVLTITALAGFHSPEYTLTVLGDTIEVRLNTPLDVARTSVTMTYQTITGANISITVP